MQTDMPVVRANNMLDDKTNGGQELINNMNECSFVSVSFSRVGINDEKKKGVQKPLNTLAVYLLFVLFNQTKL